MGIRLDKIDDALNALSLAPDGCIFTSDDVAPEFYQLQTRLAGEVFQKFANYHFRAAFVLPSDHNFGQRVTELAREHKTHPLIRFFTTVDEAQAWLGDN